MSHDAVELLLAELPVVDRRDPGLRLFVEAFEGLAAERGDLSIERDAAGGLFLERETPFALSPGAAAAAMARIDREIDHERRLSALRAAARALDEVLELPAPVRDAALVALEDGTWVDAAPGARKLELRTGGETRLVLWRLEPGAGPGKPDHAGREVALVLAGAFRDAAGVHVRGDVAIGPVRLRPTPAAEPGRLCWLLTLTRAPTAAEVSGLLDRALKRD
jgi:putative transcriptional regulator